MAPVIRKLLIANRGEIAVRVARTCREMGIRVVAVYSEADREALHVRAADEAYFIGSPPARESYLRVDALLDVARRAGADAIHPGYGFLSENAEFARACGDAGVIFVGPAPEAIRVMGNKTLARQTMAAAGVPVVPGDDGGGRGFPDAASALAAAERLGFPVMIKAAAGGGGKGMRLCADPARLARDFDAARREAKAAFGDDTVYLEKFIDRPRHVEIQIFGDARGSAVHLGERDCSIQRRHQKVIEETPSPAVDDALRERMGEVAVRAAKAIGYVGAGTIECLLGTEGHFYFLEMNTRLQVEHPVTELVTGLDLVRWQILVAAGGALPLAQEQIARRGAAIECRVYAEDPVKFLPSPGRVAALREPSGPGVRVDTGVEAGSEVTPFYDPLIAKLAVWHESRPLAIARALRALGEYYVGGIKTNLALHRAVLAHPEFAAGRYDTGFLERHRSEIQPAALEGDSLDVAIAAAALDADARRRASSTSSDGMMHAENGKAAALSAWRQASLTPKRR